jgi:hypothetical protein
VSELLTVERRDLDITSGRLLITDSSLPLAETSTGGSPVAPAPHDGPPELSAPAEEFLVENPLEGSLSFF